MSFAPQVERDTRRSLAKLKQLVELRQPAHEKRPPP